MPDDGAEFLRVTVCPRCRYDLAALPPTHACPECGFEYDESMIAVGGWTTYGRPAFWQPILSGIPTFYFAGLTFWSVMQGNLRGTIFGGICTLGFGTGIAAWWMNFRTSLRGETEAVIVIDREGLSVWRGGRPKRYGWKEIFKPVMKADHAGLQIRFRRRALLGLMIQPATTLRVDCAPEIVDDLKLEVFCRYMAANRPS